MLDETTLTEQENHEKRQREFQTIESQTWSSITDLGHGILVYHDVL
jgi:hypothetical protein